MQRHFQHPASRALVLVEVHQHPRVLGQQLLELLRRGGVDDLHRCCSSNGPGPHRSRPRWPRHGARRAASVRSPAAGSRCRNNGSSGARRRSSTPAPTVSRRFRTPPAAAAARRARRCRPPTPSFPQACGRRCRSSSRAAPGRPRRPPAVAPGAGHPPPASERHDPQPGSARQSAGQARGCCRSARPPPAECAAPRRAQRSSKPLSTLVFL
ncbi:hypothetical protein G6F35_015934 [Rhizopus arrhizus]|nr:hypothetical protein G6F35_015934 [Rhizopus arrhizus]